MADISMCNGENCPDKDTCYRYTAPANEHWQTYAMFDKLRIEGQDCPYYVDNTGYSKGENDVNR